MAMLHDWAFVTARVLFATSAQGSVRSASEPGINQPPQITKEAAPRPADSPLFVGVLVIKGKHYCKRLPFVTVAEDIPAHN